MLRNSVIVILLLCAPLSFAQDQPWPVTTNDPAFLELTVSEIYNRVRDRLDSLVNSYLTSDSIWFSHAHGDSLWADHLYADTIEALTAATVRISSSLGLSVRCPANTGRVNLYENPSNGDNYTILMAQPTQATDRTQYLQDAGGTIALTSDVWSRTGDTLVQSGTKVILNRANGSTRDTVVFPVPFATSGYTVVLNPTTISPCSWTGT